MSKAHSGSLLPIKNGIIIPIEYEDTLFPFYWNKVSGRGHEPIADVSTAIIDDKFGHALAVEDGTTNLLNNGGFETGDLTGWGSWSAYGNTISATVVAGKHSNHMLKLEATEGTCMVDQNVGKLTQGVEYTYSSYLKFASEYVPQYEGFYYFHVYSNYNGTSLESDGATNSVLKSSGADWSNVEANMYVYAENGLEAGIQESGSNSDFAGYVQSVSSTTITNSDGTTSTEWSIVLDRQLASGTYSDYRIRHRDDRSYHNVREVGLDVNRRDWQHSYFTFTTPTHPWYSYTTINVRGHSGSGVPWKFYVDNIQLEQKSWATSFVDGTRASGEFTLPKEVVSPKLFTVNAWVKHNALPSQVSVPSSGRVPIFEVSHGISSTNRLVMGFRGDDILDVWVGNTDSTNNTGITTSYKAVKEEWTMYSITFSNGVYRIYVNGNLVKSQSAVQFTTVSSTTFNIGSKHHGILNGLVSNFMISPRVWSDQAIKAIYEYGRPLYDPMNYYSVYGE